MPRHSLEYPQERRNTVIRKGKDRGKYDLTTVHNIIKTSLVVHVAFSPYADDPFPAVLPMIAVMGSYERPSADLSEPLDCYLHGYVSSRLMNVARSVTPTSHGNSSKDITAAQEESKGLPVSMSAAKVDGLILSLTPNSHSYNYRSAILFGYAIPVLDPAEKIYAMELITNKIIANRWDNTRTPPNPAEMQSTNIIRVKVENGSAKVREKGPIDDRVDLDNEEVRSKVWTGFVPLREVLGEPLRAGAGRVEDVPDHVKESIGDFNRDSEAYISQVIQNVKEGDSAGL